MVGLNLLFGPTSYATLEAYTWKDYNTISAASGIYGSMSRHDGDAAATEFEQVKDRPNTYVIENAADTCTGKLILTIGPSDSKGTLSSEGDCPAFQGADKTISLINSREIAVQSVENEEKTLFDLHKDKSCKDTQSADKADCEAAAATLQREEADKCFAAHNYKQDVTKGDAYLDCLAKALGVERPTDQEEEGIPEEPVECNIEDSGWVVCQVVLFISNITDKTFDLLLTFLTVDPLSTEVSSTGESTTYSAWGQMRNIANVIFVVAFMIIIYSQLTSMGIGAYGVKKLMPRLVVASILMNVSFYICAIAIDISNVVGTTAQSVLFNMSQTTPAPPSNAPGTTPQASTVQPSSLPTPTSPSSDFTNWTSVSKEVISTTATDEKGETSEQNPADESQTGTPPAAEPEKEEEDDPLAKPLTQLVVGGVVITGIAVLFAQLSALAPIMVVALFAMVTVLLVLLLRQAIIIVLVVISPIAFALYLLPNTQKWFDRWRSTFFDLLVMFPAIAIIFGGSHLASQIIRRTAEENGQVLLTIFALGIQVIPLFVAPLLIKLGGGITSQFSGIVNNKQKGVYDRSMNSAKAFRDDRKAIKQARAANGKIFFGQVDLNSGKFKKTKGMVSHYRGANRGARRQKAYDMAEEEAKHATQGYTNDFDVASKNIQKATKGFDQASQGAIQEVLLGKAIGAMDKLELEETNAAIARFKNDATIGDDEIIRMAAEGTDINGNQLNEANRRAAIRLAGSQFNDRMNSSGQDGVDKAHRIIAASANMSSTQRRELISTIRSSGVSSKAVHIGGAALGKIERGEVNGEDGINKLIDSAAKGGKFSQNALAGQSESTLSRLSERVANGEIDAAAAGRIKIDASQTLQNRNLSTGLTDRAKQHLENMR